MSEIQISTKVNVTDSVFLTFKERAEQLMKLSIIQAISSKFDSANYKHDFAKHSFTDGKGTNNSVSSLGEIVANFIEKRTQAKQKEIFFKVHDPKMLTNSLRTELIGLQLDLKKKESILSQLDVKKQFGFVSVIDELRMKNVLENLGWLHVQGTPLVRKIRELQFRLHRVKCVDETNPEPFGSDEIALGGVAISDKGIESKVNQFMVGDNFEDNVIKTYTPPKILKRFLLDDDYTEPKSFFMTLFMAEKDNGGFGAFLNDAYEAIRDELAVILGALGGAAGAAIGAAIGGTVGTAIAGPLGTIIGILAGIILGALITWLVDAFADDVFQPSEDHQSIIFIPSATSSFNGNDDSPVQTMTFQDHGGTYRVRYNWRIVRA